MRDHWQTLIKEVSRMQDAIGQDGAPKHCGQDPAMHLARETIRLARLCTAVHLAESARMDAIEPAATGDMP